MVFTDGMMKTKMFIVMMGLHQYGQMVQKFGIVMDTNTEMMDLPQYGQMDHWIGV
jgi:hypothetical protein